MVQMLLLFQEQDEQDKQGKAENRSQKSNSLQQNFLSFLGNFFSEEFVKEVQKEAGQRQNDLEIVEIAGKGIDKDGRRVITSRNLASIDQGDSFKERFMNPFKNWIAEKSDYKGPTLPIIIGGLNKAENMDDIFNIFRDQRTNESLQQRSSGQYLVGSDDERQQGQQSQKSDIDNGKPKSWLERLIKTSSGKEKDFSDVITSGSAEGSATDALNSRSQESQPSWVNFVTSRDSGSQSNSGQGSQSR